MTDYLFTQSTTTPFVFQPELDGIIYNAQCVWNIYDLRWYLRVADNQGNVIFLLPLISSLPSALISICQGYFDSTITYFSGTQTITVLP